MHNTTAVVLLQWLARQELLDVRLTTFVVPRHPQPVHVKDIKEAFIAIADAIGYDEKHLKFYFNVGIEVWASEKLFEKIFKVVFINEKLFPKMRHEGGGLGGGHGAELPTLFIGSEKTQVRQIPLVDRKPWPFKFLLELGGMIVVKTDDKRAFVKELKQYLNNHPQYRIMVDAKECPDGSIAVFTYWFQELKIDDARKNINVK